ncbi:hypothetical protein [Phenylobacterium sp.]|uniref:hypothetical protein n=1 Tax=Phenylobacterium sp. TaxID=1871053 RepID=UPI002C98E27E|nr:hypothetical protein [Phenylobacterium sp.]HVI31976.1 hypothetical protein [Phenylobacterium sp.]
MKKLTILTLAGAASALALSATAASAQPYHHPGNDWQSINQRQQQLDRRIERGVQRGDLTRTEARRLRGEFNQLARLEHRYRVNGLTRWERADLDRRFDRLAAQIRFERRDRDYGYGYGDGYRR